MDEEIKKEQKETAPEEPQISISNIGERDKSETTPLIDDANLAAKRMEEANKERRALLDREEALMAKKALGGITDSGQRMQKQKETDEEYAARFRRGEANPLKDDGFI